MLRKLILIPLLLLLFIINSNELEAQCTTGYNQVTLNWDNLDYFAYTGYYVAGTPGYYLSGTGDVTTQNFAFGTNRLTIALSANISAGENATHTGELTGYTGDDVQYTPTANGQTITLTFDQPVLSPNFTLYDIDGSAQIQVEATSSLGLALPVTATKQGTSILTIAGIYPITPTTVTATSTTRNNNDNQGSATFSVATGNVKSIKITVNTVGSDASFWMSDIIACSAGSFPTNYFNVSKPFTGMPGYVLHALDDDVYAVNPATGVTKKIFTDPGGNVNSMAYDPYNRVLYYVNSLTASPGTNKILKKYDFNTETISTVLADITTIGVPIVSATSGNVTYGTGVESGAAAFYNGSLYIGIETNNKSSASNLLGTSNREAVIWRIDFDASNIPYRSSQVYATPIDNGSGSALHDWSDFTIKDGVLYDFDGAGAGAQTDIDQINMLTGAVTNFNSPATYTPSTDRFVPNQPTVDWNGNIYNLGTTNPGGGSITPYIALYNTTTGRIGTKTNLTSTPAYTPAIPSVGDAAEGFRPLVDYGDAPASYDPTSGDPAVHELDSTLNLGTAAARVDREWVTRGQTALANADNYDDGVGTVTILDPTISTYVVAVSVYNHTGASANVRGWLDYNNNGVFDAGEASGSVAVSSSTSVQSINLSWSGISTPLTSGSYTYLRIRVASSALATSAATGYLTNGEVEDYRVLVDHIVLGVKLLDFNASAKNKDVVSLTWSATKEENFNGYQVERSVDGSNWNAIGFIAGDNKNDNEIHNYHFNDLQPLKGHSYYRLKLLNIDGTSEFSAIRSVVITDLISTFNVIPNPARDRVSLTINSNIKSDGSIRVINVSGETVLTQFVKLETGNNTIPVNRVDVLQGGTYIVQLVTGGQIFTKKLIISK
jgi:hypothetical protein